MTPLLETSDLSVSIGKHLVCRHLDLKVCTGEHWVILGCNGAGKSTLLATLAGLRPASAGSVSLKGQSYDSQVPRAVARQRGWLAQQQGDLFANRVLDTALIGRHPHLGRWDWENEADRSIALHALNDLGLEGLEARNVHTLSSGERQRLALATLLVQQPSLFLLDEPLAHLDLNHQMLVLERLRRETLAGAAVVSVLHDPALAWRYADRVLLLDGAGHVEQGSREDMLTEARLSKLYGYPLLRVQVREQVCFVPQ